MSVCSKYYVIAGCDLSGEETEKFKNWIYTEEGEKYTDYQRKGNIQFFTDPMNGSHLYFGYILAAGNMYDFNTSKIQVSDIIKIRVEIMTLLSKMIDDGLIKSTFIPEYQVIAFEECV